MQCFTYHRTFSMIDDKNEKMKKLTQYFPSHYLFWRLNILSVLYNECIPQLNRTQNRLKAFKEHVAEESSLAARSAPSIMVIQESSSFFKNIFSMYLYILNNKLLVKSVYSKIYLKKPKKVKAQYLTSFFRAQKLTYLLDYVG